MGYRECWPTEALRLANHPGALFCELYSVLKTRQFGALFRKNPFDTGRFETSMGAPRSSWVKLEWASIRDLRRGAFPPRSSYAVPEGIQEILDVYSIREPP